ncbi:MAG: hypothetical protein KJO82_00280 [Gammaproteobacteria bacterium]|nr:hypothetical protein [Gammaproteobacteria bacterium]
MRAALPFILVFLAIFTAGCIVYVAWELSSDKDASGNEKDSDAGGDSGEQT